MLLPSVFAPTPKASSTHYASYWISPQRIGHRGAYLFGLRADCEKCLAACLGSSTAVAPLSVHRTLEAARTNAVGRARTRHRATYATPGHDIRCYEAAAWLGPDAPDRSPCLHPAYAGLDYRTEKQKAL